MSAEPALDSPATEAVSWADASAPATALTWVDPSLVAAESSTPEFDASAGTEDEAGLLRDAKLRPAIAGPGLLVPLGVLVGLVASYAGTTLLWPLHEVAPTVQAVEFTPVAAPTAALAWPAVGDGAVGIAGMTTAASTTAPVSIASITKVVSSLMVLDRLPLAPGEQGPEFAFTYADSIRYWDYRIANQSALDVPVGGVLTEYQLLQGTLLGSANNYIDRLASEIWGPTGSSRPRPRSGSANGLSGITVVTPSGFDERNVATPRPSWPWARWPCATRCSPRSWEPGRSTCPGQGRSRTRTGCSPIRVSSASRRAPSSGGIC